MRKKLIEEKENSFLLQYSILVQKEFLIAVRCFDRTIASSFLAFTVALMLSFGVSAAFLSPRQVRELSPTLIWASVFIISAVIGERNYDSELQNKAYEGVILSEVSLVAVFFSKVFITFVQLAVSLALVVITLDGTLGTRMSGVLTINFLVVCLALFSFSCISVLIGAATAVSHLRSVLFPTLLLPNIFPLYLSCVELTRIYSPGLNGGTVQYFWWILLIFTACLHAVVGVFLYPFVVKG
jgi:ABC-type transport system involved in cytochrome c biogenesis permease component